MYEVIQEFVDLHDKDYHYHVGDVYPRDGIKVTKKRIRELAGPDNKQGIPLIAEVVYEEDPGTIAGWEIKAPEEPEEGEE